MTDSVIQSWVQKLTWKEQSSLLTTVRGTDNSFNPNLRSLIRWIRSCILNEADVNGVFLKHGVLPNNDDLFKELEYQSVHFLNHLLLSLAILSYKGKDEKMKNIAYNYYVDICRELHCIPEAHSYLEISMKDNRGKKDG